MRETETAEIARIKSNIKWEEWQEQVRLFIFAVRICQF